MIAYFVNVDGFQGTFIMGRVRQGIPNIITLFLSKTFFFLFFYSEIKIVQIEEDWEKAHNTKAKQEEELEKLKEQKELQESNLVTIIEQYEKLKRFA